MNIFSRIIITACLFAASAVPLHARTYSVLAVRVDFPYEDPDHDTTSGQGIFDLRNYYDSTDKALIDQYYHPWDVPPHDRNYFENHLTSLRNYWHTVSEGSVDITFDVWPAETDSAYTMSRKFYKYGNGRTKEQTNRKLVSLLEEALTACKLREGNAVDFSRYDTFMVIHAGIGSETSGMLNDIPSAFISEEDILTYLDNPLIFDDTAVDNGIVVPEMAADNGFGGLNGIMAQMFGHRMGLPSMSNNEDGLPASGGWCLMDTGAMSLGYRTRGFVPTHPCAWSKIELGWIEPVVVTTDTTLVIAATHIDNGLPRAVRIPITSDEYLLIENRMRYAPRDSLASAHYSYNDTSGVWLSVDHYDSYIPGSGILIWRINDSIIGEHRADNTINDDLYRRGIDLLEADGRQDIGSYISFGDPRGEYTEGHDDDTFKLSDVDVLSPNTNPDSGSMWGGSSGITITVHSDPGDTMSVSIAFTGNMKGFPLFIGGEGNITAEDMNGDGADELLVSRADSALVVDTAGSIIGKTLPGTHPVAFFEDNPDQKSLFSTYLSGFSFYEVSDNTIKSSGHGGFINYSSYYLIGDPLLFTSSSGDWLLFWQEGRSKEDHHTVGITLHGKTPDWEDDFSIALPDTDHVASVAAAGDYLSAVGKNGTVYVGKIGDDEMVSYASEMENLSTPLMADLNRDDVYETIVAGGRTLYIFQPDGTNAQISLFSPAVGDPAAADIDSDGYPEIVISAGDEIYAFRHDGVPVDGFPYRIPPGDDTELFTSSPVIADLDGDGGIDIAAVTSNMRFIAFDTRGLSSDGFPLTLKGSVSSTPCIFTTGSGNIAIAYVSTDGYLHAYDLGAASDEDLLIWPMWKGGPELSSSLVNDDIPSGVRETASFEAYCYPNPITGGTGTFRFTPTSRTDCTITLYTADGIKVFSEHLSENQVIPGVPNEVAMDASRLASGLYIAKIETRRNSVFYKLGVLK